MPLAPGATVDDLGFGEDYELLAATPDPLGFTVIGRVEEGSGVELRSAEPVELGGWEHFLEPCSKCARGRGPTTLPLGSPSTRRTTVGNERTS